MNSKNVIKSLTVFFILSSLIIPVACSEDNTTTNSMSEELYQHILREAVTSNSTVEEVQQMINESKLTDPFLLSLLAKQDYVLAVSGTIPITNTGMESYEWWSNLDKLAATLAQEDVFNGIVNSKITGIEANAGGHLTIKILAGQENKNIDGDLKIIIETVNKYAEAQNIKDVPLVIREEEIPIGFTAETEYTTAENSNAVAVATNPVGYVLHPIGGIKISTDTGSGTVGFAAKYENSSGKGIVTVAHNLRFQNKTVYQPTVSILYSLGNYALMNNSYDCVFVPEGLIRTVNPVIYDGAGNDMNVSGYLSTMNMGGVVNKSGITSGATRGYFNGTVYNQSFSIANGTITYEIPKIGLLEETAINSSNFSKPGDSGGPVYRYVNGQAAMLGILEGGDGAGKVYFIWCSDIRDKLGVVPYTV